MKILKIIGTVVKSIGIGVIKATPIGNVIEEMKLNKASEAGGHEKIDWPRMIGYVLAVILFFAMILGFATLDDIVSFIKAIKPLLS